MQSDEKVAVEDVALAAEGPAIGFHDVELFGFVQLSAVGDVGRN
ncbi:hypothetical protein ACRAWD_04780 [Caulobacter segnis]